MEFKGDLSSDAQRVRLMRPKQCQSRQPHPVSCGLKPGAIANHRLKLSLEGSVDTFSGV